MRAEQRRNSVNSHPAPDLPRLFISYRRADSEQAAAPMAGRLRDHFAVDRVFVDRQDLRGGEKWPNQLGAGIKQADIFICLIGDDWTGESDEGRRIDDSDDPVRGEVEAALRSGLGVIPVLIDTASMPSELPEEVEALADYHAVRLRASDYEADFADLLATIWGIWLRDADSAVAVLTVGEEEVRRDEFLSALTKSTPSAVRTLTMASSGSLQLSVAAAREHAPALLAVLVPETIDPRDKPRVRAIASARDWDKVVIAAAGTTTGIGIGALIATPGYEWLAEALRGVEAPVEVVSAASEAASAAQSLYPETLDGNAGMLDRVGRAVKSRPRVTALLAAGTVAVAGAGALLAFNQGDDLATFTYGDIDYAVQSVEIRDEPPGTSPDADDPDPDIDHAFVELLISNPGVSTNALRFFRMGADDTFQLVTDDGDRIPAEGFETAAGEAQGSWKITSAGDTQTLFVAFPLPEGGSVGGAQLTIRVNEWQPLTIDLGGGPVAEERVALTSLNPTYNGLYGWVGNEASFRIVDAWASYEAGYDAVGLPYPSTESGIQRRATEGFVFVHLDVEAWQTSTGNVGNSNVGAHRAIADGEPYPGASDAPDRLTDEPDRYHVTALVPVDTAEVSLGFYAKESGLSDSRLWYEAQLDPGFLDVFRSP